MRSKMNFNVIAIVVAVVLVAVVSKTFATESEPEPAAICKFLQAHLNWIQKMNEQLFDYKNRENNELNWETLWQCRRL